jgi:hypothetical protein
VARIDPITVDGASLIAAHKRKSDLSAVPKKNSVQGGVFIDAAPPGRGT